MLEWITRTLDQLGYLGIALLMFAENLFPPIPSELIMPLAGFTATQGKMSLIGVLIAGVAGTVIGALPWYWAGRALGCKRIARWADRHGRWLTMSGDELIKANEWFAQHCGKVVFFGRLVPAIRTLISVPAGIAEMALTRFLIYTTLGSTIWNGALVIVGHQLGENYDQAAKFLDPITKGVLAVIVIVYVYRVIRFRPVKRRQTQTTTG